MISALHSSLLVEISPHRQPPQCLMIWQLSLSRQLCSLDSAYSWLHCQTMRCLVLADQHRWPCMWWETVQLPHRLHHNNHTLLRDMDNQSLFSTNRVICESVERLWDPNSPSLTLEVGMTLWSLQTNWTFKCEQAEVSVSSRPSAKSQ